MIFALTAGAGAGWISAVSMIENHGLTALAAQPLWSERHSAASDPVAPYVLGYFAAQGQVPPPGTSRHFVRNRDDEGNTLRAECRYVLTGKIPKARNWSLNLVGGSTYANSLTAGQMIYEADGSVRVGLAPYPVAGNRLTMPPSGSVHLTLTLHDPLPLADGETLQLPGLAKAGC